MSQHGGRRRIAHACMSYACLILAGLALAGCNFVTAPENELAYQAVQARAEAAPRAGYGAYILHPNDQLRVQVYNEPNITGDYQIDSSGFLSIPLAGRVKASGLTTQQLERAIARQLNDGLLKDPRVNVQVSTYTPIYVHGEVKRGGEFPYRPGLTVMDAVASAGGFTYRADEDKVFVRRAGTAVELTYPLDARVPVHPGDNIRIPERFF
jgi:protein involved in polysaccharide export with SLBB domain